LQILIEVFEQYAVVSFSDGRFDLMQADRVGSRRVTAAEFAPHIKQNVVELSGCTIHSSGSSLLQDHIPIFENNE